jgi:hypothetical protein
METRGMALWCAAVGRCWVLRWEEAVKGTPAGKVRTASPKLVVEGSAAAVWLGGGRR